MGKQKIKDIKIIDVKHGIKAVHFDDVLWYCEFHNIPVPNSFDFISDELVINGVVDDIVNHYTAEVIKDVSDNE